MKTEIRCTLLMTSTLSFIIAAVLFLVDTAAPDGSAWMFNYAGGFAFVIGLIAIGIVLIIDAADYVMEQRPWASSSPYRRLKNRTVKNLKKSVLLSDVGLPCIDPDVRIAEKQVFLMNAERLGIDQGTALHDFDFEIMGRVWK